MVVPAQPQRPPLPRSAAFQRLRFDKFEWGGPNTGASARWDMVAFVGADYDKLALLQVRGVLQREDQDD